MDSARKDPMRSSSDRIHLALRKPRQIRMILSLIDSIVGCAANSGWNLSGEGVRSAAVSPTKLEP